jgi:hypothetical protein
MIIAKSFLLFLFVYLYGFYDGVSQNRDTVKCWNNHEKLNWGDFLGDIPIKESKTNTRAVCPHEIVVSPFRERGVLNYRVKVIFLKNLAWTKDSTQYALAHEQLHFDIAELVARRLRKCIKQIRDKDRSNSNNDDYRNIIEQLLSEEEKMQNLYDTETAHGIYKNHQSVWNKRIAKELESLRDYSSTVNDCQ